MIFWYFHSVAVEALKFWGGWRPKKIGVKVVTPSKLIGFVPFVYCLWRICYLSLFFFPFLYFSPHIFFHWNFRGCPPTKKFRGYIPPPLLLPPMLPFCSHVAPHARIDSELNDCTWISCFKTWSNCLLILRTPTRFLWIIIGCYIKYYRICINQHWLSMNLKKYQLVVQYEMSRVKLSCRTYNRPIYQMCIVFFCIGQHRHYHQRILIRSLFWHIFAYVQYLSYSWCHMCGLIWIPYYDQCN